MPIRPLVLACLALAALTACPPASSPGAGDGTGLALRVTRSGAGGGAVTGDGVACGADCLQRFASGTSLTLTATADESSSFTGWTGCDSTDGNLCTFTMTADRTVDAAFAIVPVEPLLTIIRSGTGAGTATGTGISCGVDCTESFTTGSQVTLHAAPAAGSAYTGWTGCDAWSETDCTLTMNASRVVGLGLTAVPVGAPDPTLAVILHGGGSGTVTAVGGFSCGAGACTASFPAETLVVLQATPAAGSRFGGFGNCARDDLTPYGGGAVVSSATDTTCAKRLPDGVVEDWVDATFYPAATDLRAVEVQRVGTGDGVVYDNGNGISCAPDCQGAYPAGTTLTLTAVPDGLSNFSGWTGCDSVSGAQCTVTTSAARGVTANFTLRPTHLLAIQVGGTGAGRVTAPGISCPGTCGAPALAGDPVTLTATPSAGSSLTGWTGCDTVSGNTCTVTMGAARTVGATFALATMSPKAAMVGAWQGSAVCGNGDRISFGWFVCPMGRLRGFEAIMQGASTHDFVDCGTWSAAGTRLSASYTATDTDFGMAFPNQSQQFDYGADRLTWVSGCALQLTRLPGEVTEADCTQGSCGGGGSGAITGCGTDCDCGRCWYCESGTCRYGGEGTFGCFRGCE